MPTRDSNQRHRFSLLGVEIDALTMTDLTSLVRESIEKGTQIVISHHNAHSIYLFHHGSELPPFYANAEWIHIDGMSLVLAGRVLGLPLRREHRTTYLDWIGPLTRAAASEGWRLFHLGGEPGVAAAAAEALRGSTPGLQIDCHHGFFDPTPDGEENRQVLRKIEAYRPDVLLVGMGMPRQECWILDNRRSISAHVILPSGACMDYLAGAIPSPPRWLGRLGFEWLARLLAEPRRLGRRYLLEPWYLTGRLARELLVRPRRRS